MEVVVGKPVELIYPVFHSFITGEYSAKVSPLVGLFWADHVAVFKWRGRLYVFYSSLAKYLFAGRPITPEMAEKARTDELIILDEDAVRKMPDNWFEDPKTHLHEWEDFTRDLWLNSLDDHVRLLYDTANLFWRLRNE